MFPTKCSLLNFGIGIETKMNSAKVRQSLFLSFNLSSRPEPFKVLQRRLKSFLSPDEFQPKRALILSKVSRFEFEKRRHEEITGGDEALLEKELEKRGSDYYMMKHHHEIHELSERRLVEALEKRGVEAKLCKRYQYTDQKIKWADIIFTAGGDGTYLMAASKILNDRIPVVGVNTDPSRSEGYLCLPKHFNQNIDDAIDKIITGKFYWYLRKRLRISLIGDRKSILDPPKELHSQRLEYPEYRYVELVNESAQTGDHPLIEQYNNGGEIELTKRILPVLGLNEVFVGESLSSRVSYLEMKMDDDQVATKTRNSGLCISTGTGSTSWTFNINKLTHQAVKALLRIVYETTHFPINWNDDRLVEAVTQKFNNEIVFDPQRTMMSYTLRDPVTIGVVNGVSAIPPRGKARRIEVKSRCFDACLVIDGSLSYKFNDGMRAVIEILDEDALRTVQFYAGL